MTLVNISAIVADAWEQVMRESPSTNAFLDCFGRSYRERLMRQPMNVFGEVIPRIAIVRNNLRRLGKPKHPPRLP